MSPVTHRIDTVNPCGWFNPWLLLPSITVKMQMFLSGAMFASFVVSFTSVGWWSELGDRKGRKIVLFCSLTGAMLIDLIYLIVANTSLHEDAQDSLSLGLIIEGLLGGFATYNGVAHASRGEDPSILSESFVITSQIGNFTRNTISYVLSVVLALLNLAFIYTVLPESLKPQASTRSAAPPRSLLKSIFSPFTVFFRGAQSRKHLPLFALAFYVYSLTSGMDTGLLVYTEWSPFLLGLPRWLLLTAPRVMNFATLLCILPALAWLFRRAYGDTDSAALRLATSLSQNSILIAALSSLGVLVFCVSDRTQALYALFTAPYPLTVIAGPALYALGGAYFLALGRADELGALFGALAVWGALAQYLSFAMYAGGAVFILNAFFLIPALVLLVPDPPPVAEDPVTPHPDAPHV
ncbi:hypothetical protein DFH09DRAFT_1100578 [Mycena vulgaris]|nr:hypothetical protein DFH09DRAFT_1100578 [Mycena vulgaris]